MLRSSKISLIIFILILVGLSTYAFIFFYNRNVTPEIKKESNTEQLIQDKQILSDSPLPVDDLTTADNSAVDSPSEAADENFQDESNNYLDISRTDCDNQCKDFTDTIDLKYCRDICGLNEIKKDVKEKKGCDALEELERDYCLKDLAINTKNIKVCLEIEDTNVLKTCRNRIAEDLVEKQTTEN